MSRGAGEWARELVTGEGPGPPLWGLGYCPVLGPEHRCALFQRPAVTHLAGYFPWVASLPDVVAGDGEMQEQVDSAK